MATLLLDSPKEKRDIPVGATLKVLLSPVRGADGQWRASTQTLPVGELLAEHLPGQTTWQRLICNGRVLEPEELQTYCLQPHDEILAIPQWGTGLEAFLIPLAIGIAVSIATTALSYLLFPPAKPHISPSMDEPTFSFEGIRTTIGPGQVVPVIYGRHRVGGQLLSAAITQAMTVLDTSQPGAQLSVEALSAPPTLTMLLALGEGPVHNIVMDSLELNGQPGANFPGLQAFFRLGTATQTPMPEFGEAANTFSDGRPIGDDPGIMYTTTVAIDAFVLNISFPEGLYYLTEKGQKEDNVSHVQYRYASFGGAFTAWTDFAVAASRTSVVRFAIRREGLTHAIHSIQLRFGGARITNEIRARWRAVLDSVTEIVNNVQAYPNTALLGLRAVATDALQGALPNVSVEVFGRTVRVGSFGAGETWTDNPAWCLLDLMTHRRYGLGYPDAVMDLAAFSSWASYCDQTIDGEPRHRLNYVLDREMRAQPVLMELAGSARTILLKSEGLWTPRMTRDETPVQLLSWTNVRNLVITYTRDPDRINVMEGRFINEEQGFESDVQTWPAVDQWPAEVRKASLDLRGITKPSRVQRALQFELNRRRFEVLSLEMDCAADALVLQVHDIFRFSHPLPGWGVSGRVQPGSSADHLVLDTPVQMEQGRSYHVYVRYQTDLMELRPVVNPGAGSYMSLTLNPALAFSPIPYDCVWACGISSPVDMAQRPFRVVRLARNADTSVHIQAIAHNPTLYDEPTAEPLPEITTLFNPLGPAPPLTSLVLMEVTRVEPSGASLRVVNISWDVAPLSRGFAPYGGAMIQRRTVLTSTTGGLAEAGSQALGGALETTTGNYLPLTQVSGHVLDFDDYTVITATTYQYRVIPVSQRGVPNNAGALEGTITVTGPTTPDFFPGSPFNLRLKGKLPGDGIFEGRNIELEWDPPSGALFSETFFIQDYLMDVYAPGQSYILRRATIPARTAGQVMNWTYTLEMNTEDQIAAGQAAARRDLHFFLWARTNTNRISLDPGQLLVNNPPPDMGDMIPEVTVGAMAAIITFDQFVEPRDFLQYTVFLDTVTPPLRIWEDFAIGFVGRARLSRRKIAPQGLEVGVTYYVQILPYDTFGPGIPTQIASWTGGGVTAESIDNTPPATPTGLTLTTGTELSSDGTLLSYVDADWNLNTESDMANYVVQFRFGTGVVATTYTVAHPTRHVRLPNIGGNVTVHCRLSARDQFANPSPFTAEASITTAGDSDPPGVPMDPVATPSFRSVIITWRPPEDLDYLAGEVWCSNTNDLAAAVYVGEARSYFVHEKLATGFTAFWWVRAKDTSGNVSAFVPGPTAGLAAAAIPTSNADIGNLSITATKIADGSIETPKLAANAVTANKVTTGELITLGAQIGTALIEDGHIKNVRAEKIITSSFVAAINVGVGVQNTTYLDGVNNAIVVFDNQTPQVVRVLLGKLGPNNPQYGLELRDAAGFPMWRFATGATTEGIEDAAITAAKIRAGSIEAGHLATDRLVVTTLAQIKDALIDWTKIVSVEADAILTGHLRVFLTLGVGPTGNVFFDGTNDLVSVYDSQSPEPRIRVWLGRVGSGIQDYGLIIWDAAGNPMFSATGGGVTAFGIQNTAVTTVKVADDAITQGIAYSQVIATVASTAEVAAIGIGFPTLDAGDEVLLWASAVGQGNVNSQATMRIRETDVNGAELGYATIPPNTRGSMATQAMYTAPTPLVTKNFVVTIADQNLQNQVSIDHIQLTGLRRRR